MAAGGIARQVLEAFGIEVFGYLTSLGGVQCAPDAWEQAGERREEVRGSSDFLSLDPEADERMRAAVDEAKAAKDSLGGPSRSGPWGCPPASGAVPAVPSA